MRLIDGDELIEHVYRERLDSRELIAQMVERAPTIEPERENGYRDGYKRGKRAGYKKARDAGRKKGKWIRIYSRPNVLKYLGWTCSVCGTRTGEEYAPQWFKYCPSCGARMEEGEQNAD